MPVVGVPNPELHRICRRCRKWFDPSEGTLVAPELTGPLSAMRATRTSIGQDASVLRFQCHGCTRIRRRMQTLLWVALVSLLALVLLLERLHVLR